jgi:DNA-binding transcriptional regulator YhcF (GntR family)
MTAEDVLPKKALTEMFSTIQLYDRNIGSIDTVIGNLLADPSTAGLPGLLQDIKQRGFGMIADLLAAEDQISILTNTLQNVQSSFGDGKIETAEGSGEFVDVNAFFDPDNPASQQFWGEFKPELAENRVRINAIAYALARARKASGRLNLDDIRRAYESLKITGFIDSKTVIAGLVTVREELRLANNDLKVLYEFNKGTYPSGYVTSGTINTQAVPKMAYDPETKEFTTITLPDEIK